jgi:rhodanese-related sulfurtransferase
MTRLKGDVVMKMAYANLKVIAVLTLLMTIAMFDAATAQENKVPRITVDELKALMDKEEKVVVLDTQPKEVYAMEHIKGAISFPWEMEIPSSRAMSLPKGRLIVTYCDCGPGETDSNNVAVQLKKMGIEKVMVLADPSFQGWKDKGYPLAKGK